jgi:hypothetical protein
MRRAKLAPSHAHTLVPLAVVALWALAISGVEVREMSDVGLVSVLPVSVFALLLALTVSFAFALRRRPLEPVVPLLHVLVLIVVLYGVTALVEPEPRFATAWKHAGIVDYIDTHLTADPHIDAYFNWPGFFVLGAMITKVAGFDTALSYAAWGPLAFNLLFLAPLLAVFRWASNDPRVVWLALWIFYSTNWVGQDYIAPQALGFLVWLSILAILLAWFAPRSNRLFSFPSDPRAFFRVLGERWRRLRSRPPHAAGPSALASQRVGLLLVVILMYGAITTGHQLTPFPVLLTVGALAVFAALETRVLPVIMAVLLAAWIGYMTTTFLSGHLESVTGSLGSVDRTLNQNISARVGGNEEHVLIAHARIAMTVAIWALAVAGFLRRVMARRIDVAIALVATTPFVLPLVQPYGGEVLLRVFLFALPAVAFFIALLVFPSLRAGQGVFATVGVAVLGCFLLAGFQYTRYGNERTDSFTKGDVSAVRALYRLAPRGSTIVGATGNLPWRYRDYNGYDYKTLNELPTWRRSAHPNPTALIRQLESRHLPSGGYLIVTRSTRIDAAVNAGKPDTLNKLVARLHRWPTATNVYSEGDSDIFFLRGAA